jgi:hypothetical protein
MREKLKKGLFLILPAADLILAPVVYPTGLLLRGLRRLGIQRFPICHMTLLKAGVFPIRDHYYEPQFNFQHTGQTFDADRALPGIEWNDEGQLRLLESFVYTGELTNIDRPKTDDMTFSLDNFSFGPGDAEFWYQLIRAKKPSRIIEIGSGHSTLLAVQAVGKNEEEDPGYSCEHTCVEPYEMPWLEKLGIQIVRQKVEDVDLEFFSTLGKNDILFIDSSHMIRPDGDVLYEYLQLLPTLKPGVIVHIHDIFSPRNYPQQWLVDEVRFWNEQYLLEAFLTDNPNWEIIGAVNWLTHNHFDQIKNTAPTLQPESAPGSFYIQRC